MVEPAPKTDTGDAKGVSDVAGGAGDQAPVTSVTAPTPPSADKTGSIFFQFIVFPLEPLGTVRLSSVSPVLASISFTVCPALVDLNPRLSFCQPVSLIFSSILSVPVEEAKPVWGVGVEVVAFMPPDAVPAFALAAVPCQMSSFSSSKIRTSASGAMPLLDESDRAYP